VEFADRAQRPI